MSALARTSKTTELSLPPSVRDMGRKAQRRFVDFFASQLANPHTRKAYSRAVVRLCEWCEEQGLTLMALDSMGAAAYVEYLKQVTSVPTLKQNVAALRRLFDWWVTGGVLEVNPFAAVRLPRYSQRTGKTPVLFEEDTRRLFASFDTDTLLGLRDRALIGTMTYAFVRVSAVVRLRVRDYSAHERRPSLAVLEKGGKWNRLPCHHVLSEYLDTYIEAAGIREEKDGPLFRRAKGRTGVLEAEPLTRTGVLLMVKKRAAAAGIDGDLCNHSFRATGITNYLAHGGTLETAAAIAGHASPETTQLYNRNQDRITQAEVERIRF